MDLQTIKEVSTWLRQVGSGQKHELNNKCGREKLLWIQKSLPTYDTNLSDVFNYVYEKFENKREPGHYPEKTCNAMASILDAVIKRANAEQNAFIERANAEQNNWWRSIHPEIAKVSIRLNIDEHYAQATQEAFKRLNEYVKEKYRNLVQNHKNLDGDGLMSTVFSPNKPVLKVECSQHGNVSTDSDYQKGIMLMMQGAMSAFRNPGAHETQTLTREDAYRRIQFASMLMYIVDSGKPGPGADVNVE